MEEHRNPCTKEGSPHEQCIKRMGLQGHAVFAQNWVPYSG